MVDLLTTHSNRPTRPSKVGRRTALGAIALASAVCPLHAEARAAARLSAQQIVERVLAQDPWGLKGAKVRGTAILSDKKGRSRTLVFTAISRRHKKHLAKSIVRFSAPPELAGAGFLQVQHDERDDDRFLYLPALKRSRRIASSQRSSSFMGTDYNFADLDQRDLRQGRYKLASDTTIAKHSCYHLVINPTRGDSPYSRIELDVRKDNFVILRRAAYDKAKVLAKTLKALQLKRIKGKWFITKSRMTDHKEQHKTTLLLGSIDPSVDIPESRFVRKSIEQ